MLGIILAALPFLGKLIPEGKSKDLIDIGTKVAQEVFGTTDEASIIAKMEADPKLAEQFKAKMESQTASLREETERLRIQAEDTNNARISNFKLAEVNHAGYWSGPIIDTVVVTGFFAVVLTMVFKPIQMTTEILTVFNVMVGFLGNSFVQIINYHRGSSAGSAAKDKVINFLK